MFFKKFNILNYNNFFFENFLNNIYYSQILNLFLFIIISFIVSFIIFFLSFILIKQNSYYEKLIPYECGFEPYEDTRNVFSIQFYLIGLLFLIFDLESLFLYPVINSLIIFNNYDMFILLDFIFELILGYLIIYKWILDKVLINE